MLFRLLMALPLNQPGHPVSELGLVKSSLFLNNLLILLLYLSPFALYVMRKFEFSHGKEWRHPIDIDI